MRLPVRLLPAFLLLLALGLAPVIHAAPASQTGLSLQVAAGFDGYYKPERWLPVRVTVSNTGPDTRGQIQVSLPAGLGVPASVQYTRAVELPAQTRRELYFYVASQGYASAVEVRLVADGRELTPAASTPVRQVSNTDLLYGVWANSPSAFAWLGDLDPANGQAYVAQVGLADLPLLGQGWDGLDVLVISDVDTGALSLEQRAALTLWVQSGGRLLVMGGPAWQKTAAGLGDLLPLIPAGARSLNDLTGLADYAGTATAPAGPAEASIGALAADAAVLLSVAETPLLAARRQGFGQVLALALDPAFAPLRGWDGLVDFFRQTLAAPLDRPTWAAGFTDLSSARSAVETLPDQQLPSPLLICGFLGLYLAAVGPVNYLVLHRLKRRELAWLTIPLTVVFFSLTAYLAGYVLAGNQPTVHHLSVVQSWPGAATARVDQLVGLFSPRRATYDLEFAAGQVVRPLLADGGAAAGLQVEAADQPRVVGARTEIGAVAAFLAQGAGPAPAIASALTLDLQSTQARLTGTLTNASGLDLQDAVLLAPGSALPLGALANGETRTVALSLAGARATPLFFTSLAPIVPGPTAPVMAPYYGGGYDNTLTDLVGSSNYYEDARLYRRFSLVSALINGAGGTRGAGLYLAGWHSDPPLAASVVGQDYKTDSETLYLIALPSTLADRQGVVTVTPGLMAWTPLFAAQSSGSATPYDTTLYSGDQMAVRFLPWQPLDFTRVRSLILHFNGSSYGLSGPPAIGLWDFDAGAWVTLDGVVLGDQPVEDPARFVGPGGEVRALLTHRAADAFSLAGLDFTYTVEP